MRVLHWIACGLWLAGCMGLGMYMGRQKIRQARELEGFHRLCSSLCDTVLPLSMTIPQACEKFAVSNTGAAADFARELALHLKRGQLSYSQYRQILQGVAETEMIFAQENTRALLDESYACLQAQSGRELEKLLKRCERELAELADQALKAAENQSALYRTLGFLAGALALIWVA